MTVHSENLSFEILNEELNTLFEELLTQQNTKVLQIARRSSPHLTADDILNPHDFPALLQDPVFNYEEGLAAGLLAAQFAIRARILNKTRDTARQT